ncbi:MAG: hypothetical protein HY549_13535 [Elusimicrobia bacterium]|nr:hypothetical protein [Elusimicrobiota bacterium]
MATKIVFGSGRFSSVVTNNVNEIFVGEYDAPTKLVDVRKDVLLCLPTQVEQWGNYPTHQESWLALPFVVACHSRHTDAEGLAVRRAAWDAIPAAQWPALAEMAAQFTAEFRERLADAGLTPRKAFKSATRALQDCLLYAVERKFPAEQDKFLQDAATIVPLVAEANRGRAGELDLAAGLTLADKIDAFVASLVSEFGGQDTCRQALVELQSDHRSGRVILLPEEISLERGAEMVSYDIVLGVPDAHDMDVVSVVEGTVEPELVQLRDEISGQRLDVIQVAPELGPSDELSGGHPPFQSVGEMILANGRPVTARGAALAERLSSQLCPADLARKYRKVAERFMRDASDRKSWAARRAGDFSQVKKAIPLYRVACDLLPRACFMERKGKFPGGQDIAELARVAGIGEIYAAIRSFLERQDADQEELEAVAAALERKL